MVLIVLGIMSASIWVLYSTALNAERARLSEAAQSQARLIEAITRFNNQENISKGPEHAFDATLTQVTDAHEKYKGFGETGEFTLAQRQYDNIVFLLRHRHYDLSAPKPIPWDSKLSEPMHRALEGASGVMIGADYRGVQVLAAFEPVAVFGAGIVAKIDMAEIRLPFLKASGLTFLGALILLFWGVILLRRISQPAIAHEQTQKALGQSEARFRNLVEGSIQGFLVHRDFKVLFANQAIADIFRYDNPAELMELDSLLETIPVSERDRMQRNKDARMRGEDAPDTYEVECLAKDGSLVWVEIRLAVVDWNGQMAVQGTYVEITQRKTAEARRRYSQAQLQSILDHFPGVILLKNVQRQYVLANKTYLRQYGLTEKDVIGKTAAEIWPRNRAKEITDRDTQIIESGQVVTGESDVKLPDDSIIPMMWTKFPVYQTDGEIMGIGIISFNNKDLREALNEARNANKTKQDFLANMSHELRTPLNAIMGFSEVMEMQILGPLANDRYLSYAHDISHSARHLLDLINDILDISKIEAGKHELVYSDVDIAETVDASVRVVHGQMDQKRHRFKLHLDSSVSHITADASALRQMLVNLLSNATKFTPEGGTITLEITASPDGEFNGETLCIRISDTGIGIPEDDIAKIVTPFTQSGNNEFAGEGGTGLGLSIVNALVRLHGGALEIESEVGTGTRVSLCLPRTQHVTETTP